MPFKQIFVFLFVMIPRIVTAQEMLGIANSNFAGNMGLELNPASIATMGYRFEFNILSGDIFLQNDYIHFPANKIPYGKFATLSSIPHEEIYDHYNKPAKNAYTNLLLKLPSAVWRREKNAFGIHFAVRSQSSANSVPYHLAKFIWEGSDFSPQHQTDFKSPRYRAAGIVFGEIGLSMARQLKYKHGNLLAGGVTLNALLSMDGIYINSDKMDYRFEDESLLIVDDINLEYGHALPADGKKSYLQPRGFGASLSLGVQYLYRYNAQAYKPGMGGTRLKKYIYKVGFSLIDIGYTRYSGNARTYSFNGASARWPGFDTTKIDGIDHADIVFSQKFFGNDTESRSGGAFTIFSPMGVSAQLDISISPMIYINATAVQGFRLADPQVKRASQVSLTPRLERRRWELSMPTSFYEYKQFRLGIAVRYKWFVIGSDNLGWWPAMYEMNGLDFYFGFKYSSDNYDNARYKKGKGGHCPAYK